MSLSHRNEIQRTQTENFALMEKVIAEGDLSRLTAQERVSYYNQTCNSLDLNPLTRPFEYIKLNGKLVMYARKDCTEQLRKNHKVSITRLDSNIIDGVYIITAYARKPDGQEDVATGAVNVKGLIGEAFANAVMKCETKAKRRVTLSICGLGFTDESEVESIPGAKIEQEAKVIDLVPDKSLAVHFEKIISDIETSHDVDQLKKVFTGSKLIEWGTGNDYVKRIIEAKDKRKLELEHGEWIDKFDGETGEVKE